LRGIVTTFEGAWHQELNEHSLAAVVRAVRTAASSNAPISIPQAPALLANEHSLLLELAGGGVLRVPKAVFPVAAIAIGKN
jgi:hypothetical protein